MVTKEHEIHLIWAFPEMEIIFMMIAILGELQNQTYSLIGISAQSEEYEWLSQWETRSGLVKQIKWLSVF